MENNPGPSRRLAVTVTATAVMMAALLSAPAISVAMQQSTDASQLVQRYSIPVDPAPPKATPFQISISRDGRQIAYQANLGDGWKIYVRPIDRPEARALEGLGEIPYFAKFSPNGEWILFGQKTQIWKIPASGGERSWVYGANNWNTWEADDSVVITRGSNGIWRVPADGGERQQVVAVDQKEGITAYQNPSMLPDGKGAVVELRFGTGAVNAGIGAVSFETGEVTIVAERGNDPLYSRSGHILYANDDAIEAVPFDVQQFEATGPAVTVLDGVRIFPNGASEFDLSDNGLFVYVPGRSHLHEWNLRTLVWVDRAGNETPVDNTERFYAGARLSPDGLTVAAEIGGQIWLYDLQGDTWMAFADEGVNNAPLWTRDSTALIYSTIAAGRPEATLGRKPIGANTAREELLSTEGHVYAVSWLADGAELAIHEMINRGPQRRIFLMPVEGDRTARSILDSSGRFNQRTPMVSPDGRMMAYVSEETGVDEVYVRPLRGDGESIRVSAYGGSEPLWAPNGKEIFYRGEGHMIAVELVVDPELRVVDRKELFSNRNYFRMANRSRTPYDYDPRTDRFLLTKWVNDRDPGADIQVIVNFFEVLNRLAPPR